MGRIRMKSLIWTIKNSLYRSQTVLRRGTRGIHAGYAIHKGQGTVYGVTVPDIPGYHSYGESVEDAIKNAKEAILGHLQVLSQKVH